MEHAVSSTELYKQAMSLGAQERAALAGLLLESLDADGDGDTDAAWRAETERRMLGIDSGAVALIPWEKVLARLTRNGNGA